MPNGKEQTIAEVKRLLAGLEEARRKPVAPEAKVQGVAKLAEIKRPEFLTAKMAKEMGVDIDPDWMLKVTPGVEKPDFSFISPEKAEVKIEDILETEEGRWITKERAGALETERRAVEIQRRTELETIITRVYGDEFGRPEIEDIYTWAEEDPDEFLQSIILKGRTADTEALFKMMGATAEDLQLFFTPVEEPPLTELAKEVWEMTPWGAKPAEWSEAVKGFPGFMDLMQWLAPTKFGAGVGVAGAYLEKYVGRPWEVAILEANSRLNQLGLPGSPPFTELDQEILTRIDEAFKKYGWSAMFSEDVSRTWEYAYEHIAPGQEWTRTYFEWTNPIYWIPIGGAFGQAARWTSKIPIIGRGTRYTAAGVQAVERGITYPVAKPAELALKYGAKGLERIGVRLGEAAANRLIKQAEHLEALMEIPASEAILKGVLVDNWMKRTLTIASKIPIVKTGVERGLGWRILTKRQGQAVEDIVARGAVIHAEIARRGINAKAPKIWELRAIEGNPVKLFGFNKRAYSPKMVQRLLPEYAAEKEFAGTLEHVFTHHEMYNWEGFSRLVDFVTAQGKVIKVDAGLAYVTKLHEINTEILNLLKKEGVPPASVSEDWWIHRVVEGKFNPEGELIALRGRPGVKGRGRIGAKPSYEMHRKAPTMAEGIAWGVQYGRNPEMAISSYIEGAFKKIADERFLKYIEPFGVTPAERLAERFPEVVERAALTKTELADAAGFHSVINRAIRGEKLPAQTLKAIERRFPELGRRFRALVEKPGTAEKQFREVLRQNEKLINNLQKRLAKVEAIDVKAIQAEARAEALRTGMPDDQKLTEAFRLMDYEDRLAFRSTMDTQIDDIGRMMGEQEMELVGIQEFLATDAVATYRGHIGKLKTGLVSLLRHGEWPETLTKKQAQIVLMGREIKPSVLTKTGRVKWEYVIDELREHFGMEEQQFIEHLQFISRQKVTAQDLRHLITIANNRHKGIKRMLGVLDNVETQPELIIQPTEYARPFEAPKPAPSKVLTGEALQAEISRLESDIMKTGRSITEIQASATRRKLTDAQYLEELRRVAVPKAEVGMPEAGLQKDIFGYEHPTFFKGKGEVTQISMDEYNKLADLRKAAGLPGEPPNIVVKPKIEGVKGLEAETQTARVSYKAPEIKPGAERKLALEGLRDEVKALTAARKAPFWQARAERAFRMEQVRQPGIGEGYIMQPFAGGRIYDQAFVDSFNKFFGHDAGRGVLRVTSDIAGILRITKAALDLSAMAIQGLPSWGLAHAYLAVNPVIGVKLMGAWYKAFFQSTRAFFDPGVVAGYMAKNRGIAMQRIAMGGSSQAVDYFAALQVKTGIGGAGEWLMKHIPLKPYHRAETAFYSAGEIVRDEFWRILSPKAIARGQEFELARILDRMTGIIDPSAIGVPLTVRQLEQTFAWFAPSYTRACLTFLSDMFRGGMTGAEARKGLGGLIAAGSTMYSGVQYAIATTEGKTDEEAWETVKEGFCIYEDPITGETEWRPSGRFMTLKVGNYYFGFGGFWYGLLRLGGNIMACVNEVGERERIDLVRIIKHGSLNMDSPFIYWWYSRSSAFFSSAFQLATGKDFLGYPIETPAEYAKYIATRFEPIWAEQGLNWMIPGMARDNEIPEDLARAALIPAELFGLRTFPESIWIGFYDKVNEYIKRIPKEELDEKQVEAWREGKLEWKHLTEMQKANLLSRYPELQELFGEAQADSAVRNSPHWEAWQGRMDEEREIYYERISELTDQLLRGEIDTREYREKAGEAGQNFGSILQAIERDPNYAEIYDFFDKKEAEGDKYGFRDNLALAELQSTVLYAEDLVDSKGDYNWDERDRRIDAFIDKWGQETYDRIQQYLSEKKELKGLSDVWIRKAEDTEKLGRGYWRLPYKVITDMDEEDEVEGNIPAEYLADWRAYNALETEAEREAFIELHPDLARDWRAEYRKENPEYDARLALWGYGGRIQTREAYDLVTKWGRELGVPLEQMGLGLPPRTLIDQYFEYGDIVRETSGNSAEARLFRLEHPGWETWAEENWGWKEVDDHIEVLRISVHHAEQDAEYDAIQFEDQSAERDARLKYLEAHSEYAIARRRREAYQDKFPDDQIDTFVEYYRLPEKGYWKERFLLEHGDFYKSMLEIREIEELEPEKIPVRQYDEIYDKWQKLFDQYETVKGTATARRISRAKLFEANPEFHKDWLRRSAYGKFFPEGQVENYVGFYLVLHEGKPPDRDEWYDDDWFLMEHPDFHKTAKRLLGWEPEDFSKVPSRAVYQLYLTYKGLPTGTPRFDFRAKHPELDAWGVIAFDWTPIEQRGKREAPKTPWEIQQEVERFKEKFQTQGGDGFGQSEESTEAGMTTADWKKEYAKGTPHWAEEMKPSVFAKEFVETMKSNKAKSVLEIGCGNGRDSILFAKSGAEVTSIDVTPKAVELAKKNAQKSKADITVKVANAEKLPFGDEEFDAVFTLSVLHSTELDKSLPELYRVLRPGGVAFIYIYADTQFKSGQATEGKIVYEDYLSDIKGLGFEVLKSYKEQEDKFDESGEKHSIFVVSLKKGVTI